MMNPLRPKLGPRGFTLVELLIVIAIIAIISAVALPVVLPALNERRVSEAARQLQAILGGVRDAAIRANAPRGIRLLPDPVLIPDGVTTFWLASNRLIPIEPAPDYSEGKANIFSLTTPLPNATPPNPIPPTGTTPILVPYNNITAMSNYPHPTIAMLIVQESTTDVTSSGTTVPSDPTSWYWNIRQGDKIRFGDSGSSYTIAGPMSYGVPKASSFGPFQTTGKLGYNTERFINVGKPMNTYPGMNQFLFVTNGVDDNGNGLIDESFDGIDNDGDGIIDPMFNGLDDDGDGTVDNETSDGEGGDPSQCDTEAFLGTQSSPFGTTPTYYVIARRPVVSPGAREITLPAGIVIDLTTWNAPMVSQMTSPATTPVLQPERSRLPVDPFTYYVDILVAPSGQVIQGGAGASTGVFNANAPQSLQPFYHFWLTEREGVVSPLWGTYGSGSVGTSDAVKSVPKPNPNYGGTATSQNYMLPLPNGTVGYKPMPAGPAGTSYPTLPVYLTGERRLVTLFLKSGQIVTNSIETFNVNDTNQPFYDAQAGVKESQ